MWRIVLFLAGRSNAEEIELISAIAVQLMQGDASQQNTAMQLVKSFCECLMHCGIAMEPFAYPSFAVVRAREKTAEEQGCASLLRRLTELLLERGFFARLEDETTVTLYSASNDCEMMMTSLLLALHATNQLTDAFFFTPLFIVASSLASRRSSARTSAAGSLPISLRSSRACPPTRRCHTPSNSS